MTDGWEVYEHTVMGVPVPTGVDHGCVRFSRYPVRPRLGHTRALVLSLHTQGMVCLTLRVLLRAVAIVRGYVPWRMQRSLGVCNGVCGDCGTGGTPILHWHRKRISGIPARGNGRAGLQVPVCPI